MAKIRISEAKLRQAIINGVSKLLKEDIQDEIDYNSIIGADDYMSDKEYYKQKIDDMLDKMSVDELKQIDPHEFLEFKVGLDSSDCIENGLFDYLQRRVDDELSMQDRDYALNRYYNNNDEFNWDTEYLMRSSYGNRNVKDRKGRAAMEDDNAWLDHSNDELISKYPRTFKKDKNSVVPRVKPRAGSMEKNLWKDMIGTDQADRRPLHRKGSLNREMMGKNESLRRRLDKIVAESVKKVLKENVSNIDGQQIYRALMSSNGKYDEILQAMYTFAHLNDPGDLNDPHILSLAFEMMGHGYNCEDVPDEEYEQMKQELQKVANYLEYYGEFADD